MRMRVTRSIASIIAMLLVFVVSCSALAAPSDYDKSSPNILQEDYLYGEAAIVIDGDTGDVLFGKNARSRMYPASTTKIMTLLLALEAIEEGRVTMDTVITVPPEAEDIPSDSSRVWIYGGDMMAFGDLLYGLMLPSGNDCANAIAVLLAGSLDAFVAQMNQRATELGCTGTHFMNAHGYHDQNHYSTALDLALITKEALQYDLTTQICTTTSYTMYTSRGEIELSSKINLLNPNSSYYYEDCIGVKTGTHSNAGKCFVGAASRDGVKLITVTLKCIDDEGDTGLTGDQKKFTDTIRLFDYGFTCYTAYSLDQMFDSVRSRIATIRISNAADMDGTGGVILPNLAQISDSEYARMIRSDSEEAMTAALDDFASRCSITVTDNLVAPISVGEIIGELTYTAQNGEQITAKLISDRDVAAYEAPMTIYDVFPFLHFFDSTFVKLLILVIVVLLITLALYGHAKRVRKERRRRELYERKRQEYMRRQREAAYGRKPQQHTSGNRSRTTSANRPRSTGKKNTRTHSNDDDLFGNF